MAKPKISPEEAPDIAVTCHGVSVPHSPFLNETRISRMAEGKYEGEEIAGALDVIRPGERVLEMGAGLGVVGAVIAKNAQPQAVLSFEANPNLIPHIESLYALNGLENRISVRHQVVLPQPDRPETVTFHLRTSFLGSSLIDQQKRRTTPVDVPTASYDEVVAEFQPDVLIMDIEGGEQEFLRHADLRGIRAIVIEFHPGVYGKSGAQECKTILQRAGFVKNRDHSSRFVWACTRPERLAHEDGSWPRPDFGWSHKLETHADALIKPTEGDSLIGPSGVQSAEGADVPVAAHWRNRRRLTLPFAPNKDDVPAQLKGTWLWGGILYWNFAHFVAESLGRLWALDAHPDKIDGLVYVSRRPGIGNTLQPFQKGVFDALGLDIPIVVAEEMTRAEHLVTPGQGFGLGAITQGTPAFKSYIHAHFGTKIDADGSDLLYISRSKLSQNRGGLLGEALIEEYLRNEGYEIFHPQDHDIATQIARYKAAKKIIACDGSALHLLAMCARQHQEVAILKRRKSGATSLIETHLASFMERVPFVADSLRNEWHHPETKRARLAIGEPDMGVLHALLQEAGFIKDTAPWPDLGRDYIREALGPRYRAASYRAAPK